MGSRYRSLHRVELDPGGRTVPLRHVSEAVYFIAEGRGVVGGTTFKPRDMVYVPRRTPYRFVAEEASLILGGPCPPDESLYGRGEGLSGKGTGDGPVQLYDADVEGEPLPMIGRQARLVVWPGVGADIATMNLVILDPGEENQPHSHEESDDTIAILEGRGSVDDLTNAETRAFSAGDVVFIRAGIRHRVKADKGVRVVSVGGPCPPDYGMLRALGLI
jgi:quercetin dioxygenase-like cupin family protein